MSLQKIVFLALGFGLWVGMANSAVAQSNDYIFILGARGNPYWTSLASGITDEAKRRHVKAVVYETDTETDAEGQLNICLTAVQRKPRVIAMQSINSAIGLQCFKKAVAAGIIVGDVDAHLTPKETAQDGVPLAFTVGSNNLLIGQSAAQFAAKVAGKPNPKILIIEGAPGSLPGQQRVAGFNTELKKVLPAANIVASISAGWDRLKAMSISIDTLQRQPDLDIIYAPADVMALGAAEAVHNARALSVKIVSVDGTVDGRQAVTAGRLAGTVAQLPYLMGMKAVDLADDAAHGRKIEQVNITPTPLLTARTLQEKTNPLLQYIR